MTIKRIQNLILNKLVVSNQVVKQNMHWVDSNKRKKIESNQLHLKRTGLKFPMSQRPVKGGSDPRPKEANVQLHSNPLTMKIVGKILKWKLSIVKSLAILICKSTKLLIEREANHFR